MDRDLVLRNPVVRVNQGLRTNGIDLAAWMIPWRKRQILEDRTSTKSPQVCSTWFGPNGESCGRCRFWIYPELEKAGKPPPDKYPEFDLVLPDGRKSGVRVARLKIAIYQGLMAAKMHAGHTCPCGEKKLCVEPTHLRPMTWLENRIWQILGPNTARLLRPDASTAEIASFRATIEKGLRRWPELSEAEQKVIELYRAGAFILTEDNRVIDRSADGFDFAAFEQHEQLDGNVIPFPRYRRQRPEHQVCPLHYDGESNNGQFGPCRICNPPLELTAGD